MTPGGGERMRHGAGEKRVGRGEKEIIIGQILLF